MGASSVHARTGIGGWSSPSEDEEETRRVNNRGKMRAIDDGTRRPSLPTNDPHQVDRSVSSASNLPLPSTSDKSKGKAPGSATAHARSQGRGASPLDPLSARLTNTDDEDEHNLDTDVDLMEVDELPDRRRQRRRRARTIATTSDRSSSQIDGQFTSDFGSVDDDDGMPDDEVHMVDEDDDHDIVTRTWVETGGRRGSLPMNIPNSMQRTARQTGQTTSFAAIAPFNFDEGIPPNVEYEMQALSQVQARRPSRSLDDDLRSSALHLQRKGSSKSISGVSRATPSSEPDIRSAALADAIAIAQAQAQQDGSDLDMNLTPTSEPYAGLDLNYILGAGMNSSGSQTSIYDGRGGVNGTRMSIGSIANREREGSWTVGWGIGANVGRRPSTATVDDPFLR